jgi:hypothetical protein
MPSRSRWNSNSGPLVSVICRRFSFPAAVYLELHETAGSWAFGRSASVIDILPACVLEQGGDPTTTPWAI